MYGSSAVAERILSAYGPYYVAPHTVWEALTNDDRRLVGPAACHITNRVSAAADNKGGQPKAPYVSDALGVAVQRKVKRPKTIARKRVSAALENHGARAVPLHHAANNLDAN